MASETSQTLDRGLRVLEVLARTPDGATVTELASALGVSRTVVYRLVVTLEQHSLLRRGPDGRARLGLGVLALARQVQPVLRDAALPVLRRLADETGATAHLSVVDGPDVLTIAVVEPVASDVHVAHRVGTRVPMSASAAGRALMTPPTRGSHTTWTSLTSDGHAGAVGVAAAIPGLSDVEAAVGVFLLGEEHLDVAGAHVVRAAGDIAHAVV